MMDLSVSLYHIGNENRRAACPPGKKISDFCDMDFHVRAGKNGLCVLFLFREDKDRLQFGQSGQAGQIPDPAVLESDGLDLGQAAGDVVQVLHFEPHEAQRTDVRVIPHLMKPAEVIEADVQRFQPRAVFQGGNVGKAAVKEDGVPEPAGAGNGLDAGNAHVLEIHRLQMGQPVDAAET